MNLSRLIVAIIPVIALSACDDEVTTLGNSLVSDKSEIVIDSTFVVTGESRRDSVVQSRTVTQLLGRFDAKEFGKFSSEVLTQFMPAQKIDTTGIGRNVNYVDSMKLLMFFSQGNFTGDSLVPMGMKIYPLNADVTLPSPIYSNQSPEGLYNPSVCWTDGSEVYTGNALYNDSVNNLQYRTVSVKLPLEFARKFYSEYINNPSTFDTPSSFAKFFPGLYIQNSFGSGRVINFTETRIALYHRKDSKITSNGTTRDTIYNVSNTYMAVSPEVVTDNVIRFTPSDNLVSLVQQGNSILVGPAGYDVELEFPTSDIIAKYKANSANGMTVVNTLTFSIPVEKIANTYNINPPANVLLVLSRNKKSFFANNELANDSTSFIASYNETTGSYDFSGMRQYIIDMLEKATLTKDDYTFTLTPVDIVSETSNSGYYQTGETYITAINPYVGAPAMCRLDLKKAKIKFTYSKQSINNL